MSARKFDVLDSLYRCLESCYWHLIEKRFCFDESIALYEEPVKKSEEKGSMFDNIAYYDSVSVIAGRAVVTIDPLPDKMQNGVVVTQPHYQSEKRLTWEGLDLDRRQEAAPLPVPPTIVEERVGVAISEASSVPDTTDGEDADSREILFGSNRELQKPAQEHFPIKKSVSFHNIPEKQPEEEKSTDQTLSPTEERNRKKSLRERRMSKSLYLKIDLPKELPIIRQNSMPKFYVETPEENQTESALIKNCSTVFKSPMTSRGFDFDLYSVVQLEKSKSQNALKDQAQIHRESSRLAQIKEKIKLKKSKSSLSSTSLPHSNYI